MNSPSPLPEAEDDVLPEQERWLRCIACIARIVPEIARIAIRGQHEHTFMNPAGVRFVVGCWSDAPGVAPAGERSTVWTWFPGYAWQIEICRSCGAHVGWSFHGSTTFYGLIRDRLI